MAHQLGKNEQRQGPDGPIVSRSSALEQYERIGTIGKGSFGTVVKVKRKHDNRVSSRALSQVSGRLVSKGHIQGILSIFLDKNRLSTNKEMP